MRNLATLISRELLPRARRPGQYIGLETNARRVDPTEAEVTVAMAFADTYAIGISHLGSQILYHHLNDLPGVACDRTYCPTRDGEEIMRAQGVPLFGWESRCAIADFDVLGFSLAYEMCVTNVLTMLDLAGIPLRASERGEDSPIVVGGDALADSPEPMADFVDMFLPGDGEDTLTALVELVRRMKPRGASREEVLLEASRTIPSAYVPRFYRPRSDGSLEPVQSGIPQEIPRACVASLADSPVVTAPLVPLSAGVQERVIIEIMRGCPNACRFCQAGATRRPVRARSVEEILRIAREAIDATGYREISLLSLSTSDYPHLEELINRLAAEFTPHNVSISLPSLRVDTQLRELPKLTSTVRKGGLTIAAEAGSQRLRKAIRKEITDENMLAGVRAAFEAGWRRVKVYFMVGFPDEREEDIDAIFDLCRKLSDTRREVDGQRGAISASVSWFVPKPHTPMQWCAMRDAEYFLQVRRRLQELSRRSPVSFKFHRVERSVLEGVLCRGGREIGAVIEQAWHNGARMDAWDEEFDFDHWAKAFEATGIDPGTVAQRELSVGARLPWSHIRCRQGESQLAEEYRKMREALSAEE